jgi:hypothetical protein
MLGTDFARLLLMERSSLLGHLAHRFVSQRENLATEALCYLLSESLSASKSLVMLLNQSGSDLPQTLHFRTQASGDDGAIPDLVGKGPDGRDLLIVEAKFWAGLTEAQPVTYLERLKTFQGSVLAFVVPGQRLELLWDELLRRCRDAHVSPGLEQQIASEMRSMEMNGTTRLVLLSWRLALNTIVQAMESTDEVHLVADARQLQGLCAREDADAFLPLTSEEMTGNFGRRIIQFGHIVDDAVAKLIEIGMADTKGLRASSGNGWYGRYVRLVGVGCMLYFSADGWGTLTHTPIWFRVTGPEWKPIPHLQDLLYRVKDRLQAQLYAATDFPPGVDIPIRLPLQVERGQVFQAVMAQLMVVAEELTNANVANLQSLGQPASSSEAETISETT